MKAKSSVIKVKGHNSHTLAKWTLGMGLVGATGITAKILLKPASSKKTFEELKQKAHDASDTLKQLLDDGSSKTKKSVKTLTKRGKETLKKAQNKAGQVKKAVNHGYHDINRDLHKTVQELTEEDDTN